MVAGVGSSILGPPNAANFAVVDGNGDNVDEAFDEKESLLDEQIRAAEREILALEAEQVTELKDEGGWAQGNRQHGAATRIAAVWRGVAGRRQADAVRSVLMLQRQFELEQMVSKVNGWAGGGGSSSANAITS